MDDLFEILQKQYQQIKTKVGSEEATKSNKELASLFTSYESTASKMKQLLKPKGTEAVGNLNDREFDNLLTEIENESKEKAESSSLSEEEKTIIEKFSGLDARIKDPICKQVL